MPSRQTVICCSAAPAIAHALRVPRCPWATTEPAIAYHDEEWGVPLHDDRKLFEFLILEGAQAGLSWITILKKRENYRKAFDGFRAEKIARYGARDVKRLLGDAGIVRNRLKIAATITNAKAFLELREEMDSFDAYLWSFVGGRRSRIAGDACRTYRAHRGIGCDEPRSAKARLQVCWLDDLLRADAGNRHGQRSFGNVSPTRAATVCGPEQMKQSGGIS